jgi:hypothetical protein
VLADGGVNDTRGWNCHTTSIVLVSDAGGLFEVDETPAEDHVFRLGDISPTRRGALKALIF